MLVAGDVTPEFVALNQPVLRTIRNRFGATVSLTFPSQLQDSLASAIAGGMPIQIRQRLFMNAA